MGYDVSHHAVDEVFLRNVVIPFVTGQRELEPKLRQRGLQIAKNRFHANAWGLGVSKEHAKRFEVLKPPGFFDRLLRKPPAALPAPPFQFDTDLSIWGRPFFITDDTSAAVSQRVDEYLNADDRGTQVLAQSMVQKTAPRHASVIRPSYDGDVPKDAQFVTALMWKLELFRDAFRALNGDGIVRSPDGDELDALELFSTDFPLSAVTFMAHFRPGWMDRGHVWASRLFDDAGLDTSWFEPATALFSGLTEADPRIQIALDATIEENYTVGGYVPAARIKAFAEYFHQNSHAILAQAEKDGWAEGANLTLKKLGEAIDDASMRGMGFLEASEIYSGPLGIMN